MWPARGRPNVCCLLSLSSICCRDPVCRWLNRHGSDKTTWHINLWLHFMPCRCERWTSGGKQANRQRQVRLKTYLDQFNAQHWKSTRDQNRGRKHSQHWLSHFIPAVALSSCLSKWSGSSFGGLFTFKKPSGKRLLPIKRSHRSIKTSLSWWFSKRSTLMNFSCLSDSDRSGRSRVQCSHVKGR